MIEALERILDNEHVSKLSWFKRLKHHDLRMLAAQSEPLSKPSVRLVEDGSVEIVGAPAQVKCLMGV